MPEDRVTITADASQYFDVLSRAGVAADRLGGAGTRIGESFIRGDRVVRVATANITQGLLTANSAADAAIISMQSLERVFRIPIGLTIFTAAAIATGAAIVSMIEKAAKAREEIRKLTSFSRSGNADFLGTDQINKNLDEITAKIEELNSQQRSRSKSLLSSLLGTGGIGPLAGVIPAQNAADQENINRLREAEVVDVFNLTSKQNDLNRAEQKRLDGADDLADLDKQEIDHKERLGKLADQAVRAGLAGTTAAEQLLSVENDRYDIAVKILKAKQQEANLKSSIKTATTVDDFFSDVGSGKFIKDFQQEQLRRQQSQIGREQIEGFRRDRDAGIPLGPIAQAELANADRLAKQEKTGLQGLINADFTNLLDLSKYDFSGLIPLSNLTIAIQ